MTQTAQAPNYAVMSKSDLITIIENQKTIIQRFYHLLPVQNKVLAPGEKLTLAVAKPIIDKEKPNEKGLVRIPIDEIAEKIGMSASSASRYILNMCERFGATHEVEPYVTKKGQKCNLTYIDPSHPLWSAHPAELPLPPEKERTINGNGKFCEHCKTYNLQVTTQRLTYQEIQECDCCGYKKVSVILDDNAPLQPGEYIPEKKGSQSEEPFEDSVSEVQDTEKAQTSATLTYPSTPPALQIVSSQETQKAPQPEDLFSDAAQLLLEIAGSADNHIEMCRKGPDKYTTNHRSLHLGDLFAHLRGLKTKGATLQHADGKTRAICVDADNPEDWQRLEELARSLAAVGFKVILEPSPVQDGDHVGGGHLWIIFDGPVDAYSALQTLYDYVPDLKQCKEYWPRGSNNRVRLPGGKYIKAGFEAWCKLYDAYGSELSHDGAGAALALLEHQTPAGLVIEHTKPAPELAPQRTEKAQPHAAYLEKGVVAQVIAEFNALHGWESILGESNSNGKYLAVWRGDRTPNVSVNRRTDLAKDFAQQDEPAMDKYDCYCRIEAARSGEDWKMFRRRDLAERCAKLREQQTAIRWVEAPCGYCGGHEMRQRDDGMWLCVCYWKREQVSA